MRYLVQAAVLLRAQLVVPAAHSILNVFSMIMFACLGLLYGFFRFVKTIKVFQAPSDGPDAKDRV